MAETRDVLLPLGCFPAFGNARTPCQRCDARATAAATWLLRGEVIVIPLCDEHVRDAQEWISCSAVWLTGRSALRQGAAAPTARDAPTSQPTTALASTPPQVASTSQTEPEGPPEPQPRWEQLCLALGDA